MLSWYGSPLTVWSGHARIWKRKDACLVYSSPPAARRDKGSAQMTMLASVLGSRPRAGLCSGPSLGLRTPLRARSTSVAADPHRRGDGAQGHAGTRAQARRPFWAAGQPPPSSFALALRPWCSVPASQASPLDSELLCNEPHLTVVFTPRANWWMPYVLKWVLNYLSKIRVCTQ